jgi:hypothetical protein
MQKEAAVPHFKALTQYVPWKTDTAYEGVLSSSKYITTFGWRSQPNKDGIPYELFE